MDLAEDIPLADSTKLLLELTYFRVQLFILDIGDMVSVDDVGQQSWLKCIKGIIRITGTDTMVPTDETVKISTGQGIENVQGEAALAIILTT